MIDGVHMSHLQLCCHPKLKRNNPDLQEQQHEPHLDAGRLTSVSAPRCLSDVGFRVWSATKVIERNVRPKQTAASLAKEWEGERWRAAATHHLPSLAHPHHRLCVPAIQSAEGAAEKREGGIQGVREAEGTPEERRREERLSFAAGSANVVSGGGTLRSCFLFSLLHSFFYFFLFFFFSSCFVWV